jgi:hypothetical protein
MMAPRMRIYAGTIFLSAFLLFQIQPIVGKTILPRFGGSAAVWTTCLLFFQMVLLLGYLYADWLTRTLKPRAQHLVHAGLLAASALVLWVGQSGARPAANGGDPTLSILVLLAGTIGLPYFVLSTTSPLLQAWYSRSSGARLPYRLYALSNVASLTGLLAYPILAEPLLTTRNQRLSWSVLYCGFALLCAAAAFSQARHGAAQPACASDPAPPPSVDVRLLWVVLPACASALLLAVTTHLTQDVAPVPFLWILPLGAYLASFIVCFDRDDWYRPRIFRWLALLSLAAMALLIVIARLGMVLRLAVPVFIGGLFLCCVFCHGELARLKPHARRLTSFYLMMALGGALGSLFVGVVAPHIYRGYFELQVSMAACTLLIIFKLHGGAPRGALVASLVTLLAIAALGAMIRSTGPGVLVMARNFYGAVRVDEVASPSGPLRKMQHGRVVHGEQFVAPDLARRATTYYGPDSGIGRVLGRETGAARRVGIIGLGCGTLACYARPGDRFRYYEINPLVVSLARSKFRYLADCAGTVEVVLGDARLSLERETPKDFDVLVLDAFSGDSIPMHLLTREAVELYLRHLRPQGVLAVHITNGFLNLAPVVATIARSLDREAGLVTSAGDSAHGIEAADWVLVTAGARELAASSALPIVVPRGFPLWTDDYSNLIRVLK